MVVLQTLEDHYFIPREVNPIVSTKEKILLNVSELVIIDRARLDALKSSFKLGHLVGFQSSAKYVW